MIRSLEAVLAAVIPAQALGALLLLRVRYCADLLRAAALFAGRAPFLVGAAGAVVGYVALLVGCSASSGGVAESTTQRAALVVRRDDDPGRAARRVAEIARDVDVVYLGEHHDNPVHHAHQLEILEALVALGLRPTLAFEMLDGGQQGDVERALAEPVSESELSERLRWRARGWPDFAMYYPLFALAARARLPVVALDLDPAVTRRIAREGSAILGGERAALVSLLPPDDAREAAIAREIRDGHCGLLPEARVPTMVEAWHARNVTMARRLAVALDRDDRAGPVVVIAGRGHQEPGGLPAQLAALRPGTRQLVVAMVEAAAGPGPENADVIWITPAVERGDPCAGLRAPR